VIDTGVMTTHVDFGGRCAFGYKADPNWSNSDGNGHGTHVASEIMGTTWGVAKDSTCVGVKVLSDAGSGTYDQVIAGIDWTLATARERGTKSVANLSLGGGAYQAVDDAVNALVASGVLTAVAAGNSNANACNYSPARAVDATTVGSTDLTTSDIRSSFSNYGPCCDIFAPGSNINGAWIGSNTATRIISGTSMASPHVAGAAALLWGQDPTNDNKGIETLLKNFANSGVINMMCGTIAVCNQSPNLLTFTGCDC